MGGSVQEIDDVCAADDLLIQGAGAGIAHRLQPIQADHQ